MPTLTALGEPERRRQAQGLAFLYPYDKTVWPRGLLAPLLQWTGARRRPARPATPTPSRSASRPPTARSRTRAPSAAPPSSSRRAATSSACPSRRTCGTWPPTAPAGRRTRSRSASRSPRAAWRTGPSRRRGPSRPRGSRASSTTSSYGTQLAQNYSGAVGGNGQLRRRRALDPRRRHRAQARRRDSSTPPDVSGCRVCHSVAALGSRLVVQHGDSYESVSSAYDLGTTGNTEHAMTHDAHVTPAMYPDGSMALTAGGLLLPAADRHDAHRDHGPRPAREQPGHARVLARRHARRVQPARRPAPIKVNQTLYVMGFDGDDARSAARRSSPTTPASLPPRSPGGPRSSPTASRVVYHHQTMPSVGRQRRLRHARRRARADLLDQRQRPERRHAARPAQRQGLPAQAAPRRSHDLRRGWLPVDAATPAPARSRTPTTATTST